MADTDLYSPDYVAVDDTVPRVFMDCKGGMYPHLARTALRIVADELRKAGMLRAHLYTRPSNPSDSQRRPTTERGTAGRPSPRSGLAGIHAPHATPETHAAADARAKCPVTSARARGSWSLRPPAAAGARG